MAVNLIMKGDHQSMIQVKIDLTWLNDFMDFC